MKSEPDYGYHYLHKLFERDYEIQASPLAQQMAMRRLTIEDADVNSWIRRSLGRDFAGAREVDGVLSVPALWVPRLMIRSLDTFRLALGALLDRAKTESRLMTNDLGPSFPFWLFLFCVLHHLLPPDRVETFVSRLARVGDSRVDGQPGSLGEFLGSFDDLDPRMHLKLVLDQVRVASLPSRQLGFLYRLVREKTPRSLGG